MLEVHLLWELLWTPLILEQAPASFFVCLGHILSIVLTREHTARRSGPFLGAFLIKTSLSVRNSLDAAGIGMKMVEFVCRHSRSGVLYLVWTERGQAAS